MNNKVFFSIIVLCICALQAQNAESQQQSTWALPSPLQLMSDMKTQWLKRIGKRFNLFAPSPFASEVAKVRIDNALLSEEKVAIKRRLSLAKNKLNNLFGSISSAPKVAIIASGGGLRASLAMLGALSGMEKAGLLDMVLWVSSLSGSTWSLGAWMQMLIKESVTVEAYSNNFIKLIQNSYITTITRQELDLIVQLLLVNVVFNMPISLIDLYGGFLANRLLSDFGRRRQVQRLSEQMKVMRSGRYPIPIYTSVSGIGNHYKHWYAFTPWEVSLEPEEVEGDGFSIPSWGLGREYDKGLSIDYKPEKTLGFDFGTFGSAFSADVETIVENSFLTHIKNPFISSIITYIKKQHGSARSTSARLFNFMRNIEQAPFKNEQYLRMVDAGLAFNLPYPPVSGLRKERAADVLIFIDASGGMPIYGDIDFKRVEQYARAKGLKFPKINHEGITEKAMSIFFDEKDASVPTVIYMPLVKDVDALKKLNDPEYIEFKSIEALNINTCCDTTKGVVYPAGTYNEIDADQLIKLMKFNVLVNKSRIWEVIHEKAAKTFFSRVISKLRGYFNI